MAAENGYTYISYATNGTVKISTILGYKTMYMCKIMLVSKYNSNGQPENDMAPKTGNNYIWTCDSLTDSI